MSERGDPVLSLLSRDSSGGTVQREREDTCSPPTPAALREGDQLGSRLTQPILTGRRGLAQAEGPPLSLLVSRDTARGAWEMALGPWPAAELVGAGGGTPAQRAPSIPASEGLT